jgi:hypothetical protein
MGGTDWTILPQDRDQSWGLVNTAMKLLILVSAGNFLTSRATVRFSKKALLHVVGCVCVCIVRCFMDHYDIRSRRKIAHTFSYTTDLE